ncbi:MAG: helix-turn-helix transcriptional regulator [Spirochaetaceae bacterium]|nr:helix-turn-helix transcriptional regulator [Spirochaetaceae bacterium]
MTFVEMEGDNSTPFKKTGLVAALFLGFVLILAGATSLEDKNTNSTLKVEPLVPTIVGCACSLLFLLSTLKPRLYWLQPILMMALVPVPMFFNISSMFSLCCFLSAMILLDALAFFRNRAVFKVVILVCYYCVCEIIIGLISNSNPGRLILSIVSVITMVTSLYGFMKETRPLIYQKASKPSLSLKKLGVTKTEGEYLRALMKGVSIKEIAIDSGVKESTVRNTLARVYRKFDVHDKAMLLAKCEKFAIEE